MMNTQRHNPNAATFIHPLHVHVSKDGRYLIITLPGNQILSKPLNYFRAILERLDAEPSSVTTAEGEGA